MDNLSDINFDDTTDQFESACEDFEEELPKGEATRVNNDLNSMFVQRLEYLERASSNDLKLKLIVYQEWTDALLQSTQSAIKHKDAIENEILEKVQPNHCFLPSNVDEINMQVQRCREDIKELIKFIRICLQEKDWEWKGIPQH